MKKYFILFLASLVILLYLFRQDIYLFFMDEQWPEKLSAISTALAAFGGLVLMVITLLYLLETQKQVAEMQKQNEPAVVVKIIQSKEIYNSFAVWIKNTGGSPAYNIKIAFNPDLPYIRSRFETLNSLPIFQQINYLEKNEEIEFFFAQASEYLNDENNFQKETIVTIVYYDSPANKKIYTKEYQINLKELDGLKFTSIYKIHNLVEEVRELKQTLLLLLAEYYEGKNKDGQRYKYFKRSKKRKCNYK